MIILRQREFGNKANKAARKRWEAEQGRKAPNIIDNGIFGKKDANKAAKFEVQLEKGGGTGSPISVVGARRTPVDVTGVVNWAFGEKDFDPNSVQVSEDEILRRKYRDSQRVQKREGKVTNVDQAINKRSNEVSDYDINNAFSKKRDFQEYDDHRAEQAKAKHRIKKDIKDANDGIYKDSKYVKNLKKSKRKRYINSTTKKVKDFVKDNKKGLAIGGAAIGAAVGGGIAINRALKKKKEKEAEKKNNKKEK